MPRMIFVNLPVADLAAATRFYEAIGCVRNEQFSNDKAASMVWSDTIHFQLLTHGFFQSFTSKTIADASQSCEVMLALSCDSREEVDALIAAGAAAGGRADVRPTSDMGWMYNRKLDDPDGHVLEILWLDMAAFPGAGE